MPGKYIAYIVVPMLIFMLIWVPVTIKYPDLEKFQLPVIAVLSLILVFSVRRKIASETGEDKEKIEAWGAYATQFHADKAIISLAGGLAYGYLIGNGSTDTLITAFGMTIGIYGILLMLAFKMKK